MLGLAFVAVGSFYRQCFASANFHFRPSGSFFPCTDVLSSCGDFFGSPAPPGLPLLLSPFLQEGGMRGGGLGMPLCCFPRVFLPSSSPFAQRGSSGRSFGDSRESSVSCSRDSCSSGRGSRKDKRARSRESSSRGRRRRSHSRSSSRSRSRGRERRRRSSSASLSSRVRSRRERLRSSDRYRSRRGSSRSRRDRSRSSDRYRSRRDRSRRERSRSVDRNRSRRERTRSPAAGGSGVTVRGRTLSRVGRVTARGQACDYLLPLPACGPRKQDGWPDEEPRRVWRRLPLSLLWFLEQRQPSLLLQEGRPLPLSRLLCRSLPSSSWACQVPLPWEHLETWRV